MRIKTSRYIKASIDKVFQTVSNIENFSKAIPAIVRFEYLSDKNQGVGTKFRETRLMGKKEQSTDLEVTEYAGNEYIRILSDTHGTTWDSIFSVKPVDDQVELTLTMEAKAHGLLPKLINPLIKGLVKKALENDMDLLKSYCEK